MGNKYLLISMTIALTVYAQVMIKWRSLVHSGGGDAKLAYLRAMYTDAWVWSVALSVGLTSILWSLAIQRVPLSFAYPFMALSFALVPLASLVLFGETLSPRQFAGILLIVSGVGLSAAGG